MTMKRLLLFPVVIILCFPVFGQQALTRYFPAGQTNAGILIESYVSPMAKDMGSLMNNGWVNTGATHKRFGFDLSVTVNTVPITSSGQFFTPPNTIGTNFNSTDQYSGPTPTGASTDQIPTAYGPKSWYPKFTNTSGSNAGVTFQGPDGAPPKTGSLNYQILPTIQLGFGLFKNTDIRIRYTPQETFNTVKVGNYGFGLMHDLKQHIPGIKMLPFSLSVFLGYTQLKGTVDLSGNYAGSNQQGQTTSSAVTGQVIISKSLSIITFYGVLGYNQSSTKFDVKGTYNVNSFYSNPELSLSLPSPFTLTDPYSYSFSTKGFRATGGARLKAGPIFINGDYTFFNSQKLITLGAGLWFR
jgi:hypothetical protein